MEVQSGGARGVLDVYWVLSGDMGNIVGMWVALARCDERVTWRKAK